MRAKNKIFPKRQLCLIICAVMLFQCLGTLMPEAVSASPAAADVFSEDERGITVEPRVSVPDMAYEGHSVLIGDDSLFRLDGDTVDLGKVYDEGIASVEFNITDGRGADASELVDIRTRDCEKYQCSVVFSASGSYSIEMIQHISDGRDISTKQRINILKAPVAAAAVTGAQKQERLQRIDVSAAQNPLYPLKSLTVSITAEGRGESLSIIFIENSNDVSAENSAFMNLHQHIILGGITSAVSADSCYRSGSVEFMSTFEEDIEFSYTVTAVDARGNTDAAGGCFEVAADRAPVAAVDIAETFVREENSSYAIIEAEDISQSDGDSLKREWFVRYEGEDEYRALSDEPGYTDLSGAAGNAMRVSFHKKGTGVFYIKLRVTDIWTEGTMDEYTADSVRLSDETEAKSEVVNSAPHISIGAHSLKKADIAVISGDTAENSESLEEKMFEKFISNGAESYFSYEAVDMSRSDNADSGTKALFESSSDYGYEGKDTAFEEELYVIDEQNLYFVSASWSDPARGQAEEPYTVTAQDAEYGEELWHYTISSEIFELDASAARMYHDDTQRYLYITSYGRTLVLSKITGQPVAVAECELGEYNFVYDGIIYTFRADGIYGIDLSAARVSAVWRGEISGCARRIGGEAVTYIKNNQDNILRLALELHSGEVSTERLGRLGSELYINEGDSICGSALLDTVGIDSAGRAVVAVNTPVYYEGISPALYCYRAVIQVYEPDGTLVRQITRTNSDMMHIQPVTDRGGAFNYLAITYKARGTVRAEVIGIENDYDTSITLSDSNGAPACFDQIIYSYEYDRKVWLTLGGVCLWIYGQSWATGAKHGYPQRCTSLSFDLQQKSASKVSLLPGCTGFSEYSKSSDMYTAIHTGKNSQYAATAKLENQVTKRSKSLYNMILMRMKKNLRESSEYDYKVLWLKDVETGLLSSDEINEISSLAAEAGYLLYVSGESAEEFVKLADAAVLVSGSEPAETIAELATSDAAIDHSFTAVEVAEDAGQGTLSKDFELQSDRRYYFEYEVRSEKELSQPITLSHTLLPVLSEDTYEDDAYYVTGMEKENFNGSSLNDFFTYGDYASAGGLYTDCYIAKKAKGNSYCEKESEITFEIPEGKTGVLSFDYMIFNKSSGSHLNANYAEIDGERWEIAPGTTGNGSYTHPYILSEGRHTLLLHAAGSGGQMVLYTYIDNLKLSYVTDVGMYTGRDTHTVYDDISDLAVSSLDDDIYSVTGSFETPGAASVYRRMTGIEHILGTAGSTAYTSLETTDNYKKLTVKLPEGKKAISLLLELISSCPTSDRINYDMEDFAMPTYFGRARSDGNKLDAITSPWTYLFPTLEGSHTFEAPYATYKRHIGSFGSLDMYIVDETNLLLEGHSYIKAADSAGGDAIFLAEDGYSDSTTIALNITESMKELYDFKIYTIEDGKKLYVTENDLSSRETLADWKASDVNISHMQTVAGETSETLTFTKGQTVSFDISYWDHEGDPSKSSYWKYTHTPMNDGAFEQAAVILDQNGDVISESNIVLNEPVTRFYKDGMYTVEHWQEDDTTHGAVEGGDPAYDKESNHVFITFYVGSMADSPWIRYIKTDPAQVYEEDSVSLEIALADTSGAVLALETSVYFDDEIIYRKKITGISPDNGSYGTVKLSDVIPAAACGKYKVTCIVSSSMGADSETVRFTVMSRGNIEGAVYHTDKWESNRSIAGRDDDIFWPGERLMLCAETEGSPVSVEAWIEGEEDEVYTLEPGEDGKYYGSIWQEDMMYRWGSEAVAKKVIFRAAYKNNQIKLYEYDITFDNSSLYWNIYQKQSG